MTDQPQFRTVLRGLDPDQVASTIKELQTSLVIARRTAADRTVDLSTAQQEVQSLRSQLEAAETRLAEVEQESGAAAHGYGDLGSRIGSMLSLAEEEASQMRASAVAEARQIREAADADAMRMQSAAQASADEIVQRASEDAATRKAQAESLYEERSSLLTTAEADLDRSLAERRQQAESELTQARDEARRIVEAAQADAAQIRRDTEDQLAQASANRDRINAHLGEVHQVLVGLIAAGQAPLVSDPSSGSAAEDASGSAEAEDDLGVVDQAVEGEANGHGEANGTAQGQDRTERSPWAPPSRREAQAESDTLAERTPWFRERTGSPGR